MKQLLYLLIVMLTALSTARTGAQTLATYSQYQQGDAVRLHLNYSGGVPNWDAGASIENGTLILSNAMFIAVSTSKQEPIAPFESKVLSVWADSFFREPFSLTVDLAEFYDLTQPGEYVVQWGCKDVMSDRVLIEINN